MRKPVMGWEGLYEVTADGQVFSLSRTIVRSDGSVQTIKERKMKPQMNASGYLFVHLSRPGKRSTLRVHRLVAQAFIENPRGLPEVNHKDGVRDNPNASNLEWCTASENRRHAYHVLESIVMPKTGKLSQEIADGIRAEHIPGIYGCKRLAKKYGVNSSCIRDIVNGRAYPTAPPASEAKGA